MRILRHDNHLLWLTLLCVVAIAIYTAVSILTTRRNTTSTGNSSQTTTLSIEKPVSDKTLPSESHSHNPHDIPDDASKQQTTAVPGTESLSQASASRKVRFDLPDTTSQTTPQTAANSQANTNMNPVHSLVFLDIAKQDFLKSPFVGRVVIQLYPKHAPRTAFNFAKLCVDKKYVNIPFHRVVKGFMVQGGDIVNQDGTGTYSVYGGEGSTFEDEPFELAHNEAGLLSMANSGPNTNGSQFFILTQPAPHLNGKHVVFGKVIQGMEYIKDIEREVTDPNDRPIRKCYVSNCGALEMESSDPSMGQSAAYPTQTSVHEYLPKQSLSSMTQPVHGQSQQHQQPQLHDTRHSSRQFDQASNIGGFSQHSQPIHQQQPSFTQEPTPFSL